MILFNLNVHKKSLVHKSDTKYFPTHCLVFSGKSTEHWQTQQPSFDLYCLLIQSACLSACSAYPGGKKVKQALCFVLYEHFSPWMTRQASHHWLLCCSMFTDKDISMWLTPHSPTVMRALPQLVLQSLLLHVCWHGRAAFNPLTEGIRLCKFSFFILKEEGVLQFLSA